MKSHRLDKIDLSILAALVKNGRLSKSELARRTGLGTTSCWERIQRLEEAGVITGYRAEFSLKALGPTVTVFVMIELGEHRTQDFDQFEREIAKHDEITGCWALGGGYDYLMQVVTRDIETYQLLIDNVLEQRAGVKRYFSYIVTKPVKNAPPPFEILLQK
jgi:Lrp/AsnC family transcriptional regulator of ectoine degradation